jgi:hypothetical protein
VEKGSNNWIKLNGTENEYFVSSPCNYELAKHVFYTKGKTPQDTAEEIIPQVTEANRIRMYIKVTKNN